MEIKHGKAKRLITKARKDEKMKKNILYFVFSSFRVFVIGFMAFR